ncbi:MAG: hypothetical protein ACI8UO_005434, partial [Verrucomicrobiales bacterium]
MATLIRPVASSLIWLGFAILSAQVNAKPLISPLISKEDPGQPPSVTEIAGVPKNPVETFLAADSLANLGLQTHELVRHAGKLMEHILDEDPDLSPAIVLQLDRLIRLEQAAGNWREAQSNGWNATGTFVRALIRNADPIDGAGFLVRIFRADTEGRIAVAGWTDYDEIELPLWHRFNAYGGNYDFERALNQLAENLSRRSGEGPMIFLLPALTRFAQQLRPAQIQAASTWATAGQKADDDREFAQQLLLALRFNRATSAEPGTEGPSVFADLLQVLRDDKISLPWRLSFAHFISDRARHLIPPDLALECGRLSARVLENDAPTHGSSLAYAIAAFQRQPAQAAWGPIANRIRDAWIHRNRNNAKPNETGLAFDPSGELLLTVMDLNYQANNRAAARRVLQKSEDIASVWAGAFILMVENDDFFLATQLLQKHARTDTYHFLNYPIDIRVNAHLEAATPEYLKTFDDPDLRAFAEVWLATGRDPPRHGPGAIPDLPSEILDDRLARVAVGFAEAPPTDEDFLRRSLECLTITKRPIPDLHPMLEERRSNLKSTLGNASRGHEAYWATHVASRLAIGDFMEGNDQPLRDFWFLVIGEDDPFARHREHSSESILDQTSDIARMWGGDLKIAELHKMLPLMREMIETTPTGIYLEDYARTACYVLVAHAICGEADLFRAWFASLIEETQQLLVEGLTKERNVLEKAMRVLNLEGLAADEIDVSLRRQVIGGVLSQPFVGRAYAGHPLLARSATAGALPPDDLAAIAPMIADRAPRSGTALTEWTGLMAEAGLADRAVGVLDAALEKAWKNGALASTLNL